MGACSSTPKKESSKTTAPNIKPNAHSVDEKLRSPRGLPPRPVDQLEQLTTADKAAEQQVPSTAGDVHWQQVPSTAQKAPPITRSSTQKAPSAVEQTSTQKAPPVAGPSTQKEPSETEEAAKQNVTARLVTDSAGKVAWEAAVNLGTASMVRAAIASAMEKTVADRVAADNSSKANERAVGAAKTQWAATIESTDQVAWAAAIAEGSKAMVRAAVGKAAQNAVAERVEMAGKAATKAKVRTTMRSDPKMWEAMADEDLPTISDVLSSFVVSLQEVFASFRGPMDPTRARMGMPSRQVTFGLP